MGNLIDAAIDLLRDEGWAKLDENYVNGRCINGAMVDAADRDYEATHPGMEIMCELLGAEPGRYGAVFAFNDDPDTTEEDVLLLMKKASALLDERSAP